MNRFDAIIVGQGLAGTALTWRLLWHGRRVCVIDADTPCSPSKAAAGLVTPVTGRRLVLDPEFQRYSHTAVEHYRRVEEETGTRLYRPTGAVRWFADESERQRFLARERDLGDAAVRFEADGSHRTRFGGFRMPSAGRLDCVSYLSASRSAFAARGEVIPTVLDSRTDVIVDADTVSVPRFGVRANSIVWCTGWDRSNAWFADIAFAPAKGETLTVRIPGWAETSTTHVAGVWMYPVGDGTCRVGATYDRQNLDGLPTAAGRAELLDKLKSAGIEPDAVVAHDAAVRPVTETRSPAAFVHPTRNRLGIFTGLSSKGVLTAPHVAEQLAQRMRHG